MKAITKPSPRFRSTASGPPTLPLSETPITCVPLTMPGARAILKASRIVYFHGLADSEFHRTGTEHADGGDLAVYEFTGGRASTCVAVRAESQVAYPSYRGSLKVKLGTEEVVHAELEATEMPKGFPLDRAERSVDFSRVRIGAEEYLMPTTGYWFGCYRNTYSCFMNRVDFRDYRHFSSDSVVKFAGGN